LAEKQGINEMEQILRELVKKVAGMGLQRAIEQGEERYAEKEVACPCGGQVRFISKREADVEGCARRSGAQQITETPSIIHV